MLQKNALDTKPQVSIITMTYNKFNGLERTIESVANQSYKNIEYIIADDGSKEFSRDYIEQILKRHYITNFKIMHSKTNSGTVVNANIACKKATGVYIMFLSEGDCFTDSCIVGKVVERFINTGADLLAVRRIVYSNNQALFFMPHILSIPIIRTFKTSQKQYEAFITTHFWDMASGSAMYYSKAILEKLDYFDEKYYLWEDGPFLEKYLRNGTMNYAFDIVGVWYEWGGVSTGSVNPLLEKDRLLFDATDRHNMKGQLSKFANKYIEYIGKRSSCKTDKELNSLRKSYPTIMISHIFYKYSKKLFKKIDRLYFCFTKKWKRSVPK